MSDQMLQKSIGRINAFLADYNIFKNTNDANTKNTARTAIEGHMKYFKALYSTKPDFYLSILNQFKGQ